MSSMCLCGAATATLLEWITGINDEEQSKKYGNFVPMVELSLAIRTLQTPAAQHTNESKHMLQLAADICFN